MSGDFWLPPHTERQRERESGRETVWDRSCGQLADFVGVFERGVGRPQTQSVGDFLRSHSFSREAACSLRSELCEFRRAVSAGSGVRHPTNPSFSRLRSCFAQFQASLGFCGSPTHSQFLSSLYEFCKLASSDCDFSFFYFSFSTIWLKFVQAMDSSFFSVSQVWKTITYSPNYPLLVSMP